VPGDDYCSGAPPGWQLGPKASVNVLHVNSADATPMRDKAGFESLKTWATTWERIGTSLHPDSAEAIADFAKQHQITQIVIGSSQKSRCRKCEAADLSRARSSAKPATSVSTSHVIARRELPAGFGPERPNRWTRVSSFPCALGHPDDQP